MKGILWRSPLTLVLFGLWACSDDPLGPNGLASLHLETGSEVITVGDTTRISVTGTTPSGQQSAPRIRLRSLDPGIVMVNGNGVAVGVSQGVARITGEAGGVADTIQISVIPDRYNVQTGEGKQCSTPDYRDGYLAAVGKYAVVVADPANPSNGFTAEDYQELATIFDEVIYPVVTEYFGTPADIDGSNRIIIYYTRAVNELTPPGSSGYVGGFFHSRDLFPRVARGGLQGCATSNEAEMFYLMVPDPQGTINNNRRDKALVRRATVSTITHEFQHLINASRRLFVNNARNFEETWLNEALSHIAEELVFFRAAGLSPRMNLGVGQIRNPPSRLNAFNSYQVQNFGRLDRFFRDTESHTAFSDSARLGDRGAGWHFLRYLVDRLDLDERDLWFRLANSSTTGFDNLRNAIGRDPLPLYRDWAITAYTDDLVATSDPSFQQPSWNHRSILPTIEGRPIQAPNLRISTAETVMLRGGGTAYRRFGIAPDQVAELRVRSETGSAPAPGACSAESEQLTLAVGEVYTTATPNTDATLCLAGGPAGSDYALIVTSASRSYATSAIEIAGYGIRTSFAMTSLPAATAAMPLADLSVPAEPDYSIDTRIRQLERTELAELLGSASAGQLRVAFQGSPGAGTSFYISVVRTR